MADCDDRRGLLAGGGVVATRRSNCDAQGQISLRFFLPPHRSPDLAWSDRRALRRWHGACSLPQYGNPGVVTMNNAASMSINPLFLRHDLMIELGRLEMAIDDVRTTQPAANDRLVNELESKCARINEALSKLPA
jgi:hypothetical protein